MQVLKFNLSGKTAMFKKPDINSSVYLTYGSIHKVALLGILGAVLGLKGYNKQGDNEYPEFYEKLKDYRVSIKIINGKGSINKSRQQFNNSTGLASREKGGNLIVDEYWLVNPKFEIMIALEGYAYDEKLKESLLQSSYEYIPYLGKNDHFADIRDVEILEADSAAIEDEYVSVEGMVPLEAISKTVINDELDEDPWKYSEYLPSALESKMNSYVLRKFEQSNFNLKIDSNYMNNLYRMGEKLVYFY